MEKVSTNVIAYDCTKTFFKKEKIKRNEIKKLVANES